MHELASMAANKAQERNSQQNEPSSNVNFKVIFIVFDMKNTYKMLKSTYNSLYWYFGLCVDKTTFCALLASTLYDFLFIV